MGGFQKVGGRQQCNCLLEIPSGGCPRQEERKEEVGDQGPGRKPGVSRTGGTGVERSGQIQI